MKIALISPRSPRLGRNPEFESFLKQSPQMEFYRQYWSGLGSGLLVIAALTPPEIEIELIDEDSEDINFQRDYDLVGITAVTQQATRAYEIARRFRERNVRVVLGGIHTTVLPDEARLHADSIIVGEAENLWPKLLDDFRHNRVSPVYTSGLEVDLRESPLPRYELLRD
ncbi:MAG: cobalamin-dependent protein, partial [Dehalococcoidales bacterium]|nr:cobalamin-dependent protein [Dehalococcoidales bacterium]